MNKAFTLVELTIAFMILLLSLTVLAGLSFGYLSILNSIKTRYIALNIAQEGIEYAIALRNKQIEKGFSPWPGVAERGSYCLYFVTTTKEVIAVPSTTPCPTMISEYRRLIHYYDFENPENLLLHYSNAVRVTSEVDFRGEKFKLDVILTKWHPVQYPSP